MAELSMVTKPTIGHIWRNGIIAAVLVVVVNVVLFFIGSALGAFPEDVLTPMGVPIDVISVITVSTVGVLGGTLVYTVLTRFLETGRANMIFTIIAILVILFMAVSPFTLGAAALQIIFLEIMHLVTGLSAIFFLTRWQQ